MPDVSNALAILALLAQHGWKSEPYLQGWRLTRPSLDTALSMHVTEQQWLCFSCTLLEEEDTLPTSPADLAFLYRSLLEQNEHMYMAKFVLDQQGMPLLMAEIPLKDTHPQLPYWAAESIAHYRSMGYYQRRDWLLSKPQSQAPRAEATTVREIETEIEYATAQSTSPASPVTITTPDTVLVRLRFGRKPSSVGVPDDRIKLFMSGLETEGWYVMEKPRSAIWHIGYKGRRMFEAHLTSSKHWLYMQVPFVGKSLASVLRTQKLSHEGLLQRKLFLKYLLHLNQHWFMARLAISTDDQVLLLMEVPTETLNFALFRHLTLTVSTYLDRFEREIQNVAALPDNKRLFELLEQFM